MPHFTKKKKVSELPKTLLVVRDCARDFIQQINDLELDYDKSLTGTKKTAALRRKSMDLTNALVAVRKPW